MIVVVLFAPTMVKLLAMTIWPVSVYVPAPTEIVSPGVAAVIAAWMEANFAPLVVSLTGAKSAPLVTPRAGGAVSQGANVTRLVTATPCDPPL